MFWVRVPEQVESNGGGGVLNQIVIARRTNMLSQAIFLPKERKLSFQDLSSLSLPLPHAFVHYG